MALDKHANPIELFQQWFEDARQTGLALPDATTLATCDQQCRPTARMVLLKGVDEHGFVFYTNMESPKAHHLANNPHAALCFYWEPLRRQVRVEGMVSLVSPEQADAYFESRDRKSKIGAWASKQSRPLGGRYDLEKRVAYYATKFAVGKVQRPDFWSGYCLEPRSLEFWIERPFRLHERLRFTRASEGWEAEWLFP